MIGPFVVDTERRGPPPWTTPCATLRGRDRTGLAFRTIPAGGSLRTYRAVRASSTSSEWTIW